MHARTCVCVCGHTCTCVDVGVCHIIPIDLGLKSISVVIDIFSLITLDVNTCSLALIS